MRINGYYPPHKFETALRYVGTRQESWRSFRDYLAATGPAPASGELHHRSEHIQPPYHLSRSGSAERPLLVLFEQRQCSACDELHLDVLKRPETAGLLEQFDIVLLDMWSNGPIETPSGRSTSIREWAQSLEVNYAPSLVFFNERGIEVFRASGYLKAFHIQAILDYVASRAYLEEPQFQRFIQDRADRLRERGITVDLMN